MTFLAQVVRISAIFSCVHLARQGQGIQHADLEGDLEARLGEFGTLHHMDLMHHISKRSVEDGQSVVQRKVTFSTLGREFHLLLRTDQSLFSRGFTVWTRDGGRSREKLDVDVEDVFKGHLEGDESAEANAVFHDQDMYAYIHAFNDIYAVEPSFRFLPPSPNYTMISYKLSGLKELKRLSQNRTVICKSDSLRGPKLSGTEEAFTEKSRNSHWHKSKRAAGWKNVCPMALVADHHFYKNIGRSSPAGVARFMIALLGSVNSIYNRTDFDFDRRADGFGFTIKEIEVNIAPTPPSEYEDYNSVRPGGWISDDLLNAFSRGKWAGSCLGHLFSGQAFDKTRLGLAWVASPLFYYDGGICSKRLNTGISTPVSNSAGDQLTHLEYIVVVAHELGHNWGSSHDQEGGSDSDCLPSSWNGGKYLMYERATSGKDDNNLMFSPCSRRTIDAVLKSKKDSCFEEDIEPESRCGDWKQDGDEECDVGGDLNLEGDDCCTSYCTFKSNTYKCSDFNHECCQSCDYARNGTLCRKSENLALSCKRDQHCTGRSELCPESESQPDDTPCGANGKCRDGVCISFCQLNNRIDCQCADDSTACYHCCLDDTLACVPYPDNTNKRVLLPDGSPCYQGFCEASTCVKDIIDNTARDWKVIPHVPSRNFVEFMRNNIVLGVCLFTLIIFIPIVIAVLLMDAKVYQRWKAWLERENYTREVVEESFDAADGRDDVVSAAASSKLLGSQEPRVRHAIFNRRKPASRWGSGEHSSDHGPASRWSTGQHSGNHGPAITWGSGQHSGDYDGSAGGVDTPI